MNRQKTTATTKGKTGFLKMASWDGHGRSTMINNANILSARTNTEVEHITSSEYAGVVKEVVHLDIHGAQLISDEDTNVTNVKNQLSMSNRNAIASAWDDFKKIATAKGIEKSQTFINSGTSVIEGEKVTYTNSYDHTDSINIGIQGGNSKVAATVINTGNLTIHPLYMRGKNFYLSATGDEKDELNSDAAVFVVSPEMAKNLITNRINGIPQILYNSGKINVYNKNSAVFFIK